MSVIVLGCAGVEDGWKGSEGRVDSRAWEEPVAHGLVPTCTPVSLGPCGDWDRRIYLH